MGIGAGRAGVSVAAAAAASAEGRVSDCVVALGVAIGVETASCSAGVETATFSDS